MSVNCAIILDFLLQPQREFQSTGFQQSLVGQHLMGRAILLDPAIGQQDHPVAGIPDEVQVVGGNELGTGQPT